MAVSKIEFLRGLQVMGLTNMEWASEDVLASLFFLLALSAADNWHVWCGLGPGKKALQTTEESFQGSRLHVFGSAPVFPPLTRISKSFQIWWSTNIIWKLEPPPACLSIQIRDLKKKKKWKAPFLGGKKKDKIKRQAHLANGLEFSPYWP